MSAAGLCELVRTAYDPAAAVGFDEARDAGQPVPADWTNAGPVAAEASWDSYRHDSGVSCTWEMVAAPRGAVLSSVLGPLLQPHPDIDRKRVTLLYRPETEGNAARIAERDRDRAKSRVTGAQKPKARDEAIRDAADNTAREIAQGAGMVHLALLVTATVLTPERLPAARLAVEHAAPAARVTLRPVAGSQDSAFAAALPIGIVLGRRHSLVPSKLRGAL